jgi:hypothetical protein
MHVCSFDLYMRTKAEESKDSFLLSSTMSKNS